jgi:phage gp45-like
VLARLASAVRSLVTRAKVTAAAVGSRTLLQISGLQGEVKTTVELLLPPGYSARPLAGADVVVFQVMGTRDHLVALGGDNAGADAIAGLAPGEFGLRNAAAGTQIVFRNTGKVEITGDLHVSGAVIAGFGTADQVALQTHKHPTAATGAPSSPTAGT